MARCKRVDALVAMGLALVLLAGCGASALNKAGGKNPLKPVVLALANAQGDTEEIDGFIAAVGRLSGGTVRIEVTSKWRWRQVDSEEGLIGDVRAGKADLGVVGTRAWDSLGVLTMRALSAPLLIQSYALQERVLQSPLEAQMLEGLSSLGLVGLGILPGPLRYPLGVSRPLLGPSDYEGLRIGLQRSLVGSATFRALGATPVWFPTGGPINGLGGAEQGVISIEGNQYNLVARYLTTNVVLWPRPLVLFANPKALARLTRSQRHVLTDAGAADVPVETGWLIDNDRVNTAILCRSYHMQFVTASPVEQRALERAVQPVFASLDRDPETRRQIDEIEALRKSFAVQPAPTCALAAPSPGRASALDGVYQQMLSYASLKKAGAQTSELVPENIGVYTWVFDRGHFAFSQSYPQGRSCTWGYGNLTVRGHTLTELFSDGGGISPTGATNKPGEEFTFDWSYYRGTLTMRLPNGTVLGTEPTADIAVPYRQISTTPSWGSFAKGCPPPANALPGLSG
jgi:TRAP-type C4-dicarboxylate transport system substrate-binding protein